MLRFNIAILAILFAAGTVTFGIAPQWARIQAARESIRGLEALHDELTLLAASRDALVAEYNAIPEADLNKLEAIAPSDPKATPVLVDFEELARQNGLALNQVDFAGGQNPGTAGLTLSRERRYAKIPVTLNVRGPYENFREFLSRLERNLRLIDVDEITILGDQGRESSITLKGTMYYRR